MNNSNTILIILFNVMLFCLGGYYSYRYVSQQFINIKTRIDLLILIETQDNSCIKIDNSKLEEM